MRFSPRAGESVPKKSARSRYLAHRTFLSRQRAARVDALAGEVSRALSRRKGVY